MNTPPSVGLVMKADDPFAARAALFVQQHFPNHQIFSGRRGDPFPAGVLCESRPDYVISYLSPWIIPPAVLEAARCAAINFHPGPPEYPGIGCTNFAIYEGVDTFGITCHHMAPRVDTGQIIAVRRFPLRPADSVLSLTQRCYTHILPLFCEIMDLVLAGAPLPVSPETWTRRPFTRAELNALCRLTPEMPADEVHRRLRATQFPGAPGAYLELHGVRFEATPQPQSQLP